MRLIFIITKKANSSKLKTKRQLSKEQVFLIYLNEELGRPICIADLVIRCGVNSSNTIYGILKKRNIFRLLFIISKIILV